MIAPTAQWSMARGLAAESTAMRAADAEPRISVIVTAHNEGAELHRTLRSVIAHTRQLAEIIVVDDGSDDGSCAQFADDRIRVVRHDSRIGVAASRHEASRQARGSVLCYLDGHQRVAQGCLDQCARQALAKNAITCPDIRGYGLLAGRVRGADFRLCPEHGYFSANWRQGWGAPHATAVTGLRAPPYLIPRALYPMVAWSPSMRGWGGSEAMVSLKAFFTGVEILHLPRAVVRHRFQKRLPYPTSWDGVWQNQALIARICFEDATWYEHWLPRVFESHLSDAARALVESPAVLAEHAAFQRIKLRTDREFWANLLHQRAPTDM